MGQVSASSEGLVVGFFSPQMHQFSVCEADMRLTVKPDVSDARINLFGPAGEIMLAAAGGVLQADLAGHGAECADYYLGLQYGTDLNPGVFAHVEVSLAPIEAGGSDAASRGSKGQPAEAGSR